jgi:hypothetical protein
MTSGGTIISLLLSSKLAEGMINGPSRIPDKHNDEVKRSFETRDSAKN